MHSILKSLLILLSILSLSQSSYWDTWNTNIANNGGNPLSPFVIPFAPSYTPSVKWMRNKNSTYSSYDALLSGTNFTLRQNQFSYYMNLDNNCKVWCGPASYLTFVGTTLLCKRDPYYWAGLTNNGVAYTAYCIPNAYATSNCNSYYPTLANVGNCHIPSYGDQIYSSGSYDCCYNNYNS
jgi:hypothetical protein